jgi:hypothetical protein
MKLLAAALTLVATQAVAQEPDVPCFQREDFIRTLDNQFGEANIARLEEKEGALLELYVMPNGYWAIGVISPEGHVCVVAKGFNWTPLDRGELG